MCIRDSLCEALEVLTAWGFSYKTVAFVWVKQNRKNDDLFTGMGSVSYTHLDVYKRQVTQ